MSSSAEGGAGAVVVAGGAGRRFGGSVPKQYLEIGGEPMLLRAARPFAEHPSIRHLVIVLPPDDAADPPAWLLPLGARVVGGGAERGDSVRCGLAALPPDADPVLIHDGARPFVGREVIDRVLRAARKGAAVAAVPVRDTLKQTDGAGRVVRTLGRDGVWQAQTPQGFPRALILSTHERASRDGIRAGDDAGLCEHFGVSVLVVDGAPENLKITSAADLLLAEAVAHLAAHVQTSPRP